MELELVLKMPPGKLPFIGILFKDRASEYKAAQLHEYWPNHFKDQVYSLVLDPKEKWINVKLSNKLLHCDCLYAEVKYQPEVFKRFLALNKGKTFNFSHIISDGDKHKVVLTREKRALFVLKIDKVLGEADMEF